MLVAPIVSQGATSRDVVFPAGTWIDWWTGETIIGPATKTVTADLDTLPLYVRAGELVPMLRDTIDTLAPATGAGIESFANDPGVLWVRTTAAAGEASAYDGTQLAATATTFHYAPGSVFGEGVMFEVIASPQPSGVHDGSGPLAQAASLAALKTAGGGWFWEPATGGTLWILLPGAGTATVDP